MKKTFQLILSLMLILIVFVSCENKPEETIKTAKDYLAGKSLVTTLKLDASDVELDEEEAELLSMMYFSFPVAFDKNGTIYANNVELEDFVGTVDGMTYKTSFTQKFEMEPAMLSLEDEEDDEFSLDRKFEIIFKVLNENKVSISGSITSYGMTLKFKETEASIAGTMPSWFTTGDWVFIPTEEQSDLSIDFTIFNEDVFFDSVPFGEIVPYAYTTSISSKNDAVQMYASQSANLMGNKISMESSVEFTKKSADEANFKVDTLTTYAQNESVEEGQFSSFETTVKRIDSLPEWAKGIYGLMNSEWDFIPVSSMAVNEMFYDCEILGFDREVDDKSIVVTLTTYYYDDYYEEDVTYKYVYIINKTASKDKFYGVYQCYWVDEDGYEYLDYSSWDNVFTVQDYIAYE